MDCRGEFTASPDKPALVSLVYNVVVFRRPISSGFLMCFLPKITPSRCLVGAWDMGKPPAEDIHSPGRGLNRRSQFREPYCCVRTISSTGHVP